MTAWDAVTCGGYLLTIKQGPSAGTTHYACLCGWERKWPTRMGATRAVNKHLTSNGYPRLKPDTPNRPVGNISTQKRNKKS